MEVSLENVEFSEEPHDFGNALGIAVAVVDGEEPLFRWAVSFKTWVQVRPRRTRMVRVRVADLAAFDGEYDEEIDTILLRDNDGFYTEQEEVIDPGETRRMTTAELDTERKKARSQLLEMLGQVRRAGDLLTPRGGE